MSIPEGELRTILLVEFGPLDDDQLALVDLHELRAVGSPSVTESDGAVIEFWVRDGADVNELYDDIRGWAIGNRLPIRGVVER
jgi:hypothetical protein